MQTHDSQIQIKAIDASLGLMRMGDITRELNISASQVYRWIKQGRFPKPIRLTEHTSCWLCCEVVEFRESGRASSVQV